MTTPTLTERLRAQLMHAAADEIERLTAHVAAATAKERQAPAHLQSQLDECRKAILQKDEALKAAIRYLPAPQFGLIIQECKDALAAPHTKDSP